MKRRCLAAATNTCPRRSPASTRLHQTRRPFLGTPPCTSSQPDTQAQYRERGPQGDQCPQLLLHRGTLSISTDGWPPPPATAPRPLWNTFSFGERLEWHLLRSSPPDFLQQTGIRGSKTEDIAGVQGAEISGFTGVTTIEAKTNVPYVIKKTSESQSLDNLPSRVKAYSDARFGISDNYIICPPASFLSPGERFIAQEQGLAVQQNKLDNVVDSNKLLIGVSSVSCVSTANNSNRVPRGNDVTPFLKTKRSQMLREVTINSTNELESQHASQSDPASEIGTLLNKQLFLLNGKQTINVSNNKLEPGHKKIVECYVKSDAIDRIRIREDNDESQTSPSSSSPETQVEDFRRRKNAPLYKSVEMSKIPELERLIGRNGAMMSKVNQNLDRKRRKSGSDTDQILQSNYPAFSDNIFNGDVGRGSFDASDRRSTGAIDVGRGSFDASDRRSTGAIPKKPSRKLFISDNYDEFICTPTLIATEAESITTCSTTVATHSTTFTTYSTLASTSYTTVTTTASELTNRDGKEYFVLCLDVKKYNPF